MFGDYRDAACDFTDSDLADFVQTLIATIAVGSLYALLALGYTMVYGVLKFINFAHSDIFVLGAWTSFTTATVVLTLLNVDPENAPWWVGPLTLGSAILVCGLVGFCIERFAYKPLRKAPRLNVLITAIGVSLFLQNVGQLPGAAVARNASGSPTATIPFGASPKSMPTLLPNAVLNETEIVNGKAEGGARRGTVRLDQAVTLEKDRVYRLDIRRPIKDGETKRESLAITSAEGAYEAGAELTTQPRRSAEDLAGATYRLILSPKAPILLIDVLITASAVLLMIGLQLLIFRTKIGTAMRAISHNIETASLMGINVNFVISFTFVLGTTLAACAAFLYPMRYPTLNQTAHGIWVLLGLKAFVAAVVGGIGNVRGAVLGGFLIAAIELFGSRYMGSLLGSSYIDARFADVYVFGTLIIVLLVRPSGILGTPTREKV